MNNFFRHYKNCSPIFLYYISLFVITNIYGLLCNTLYSILTFSVFSVVLSILLNRNSCNKNFIHSDIFCFLGIILQIITLLIENALITETYNAVSDNDSNKIFLAIFAFIIIAFSFFIATFGINTIARTSNILTLLPLLIIPLFIFSLFKFGETDLSRFFYKKDILKEFFNGLISFGIFFGDILLLKRNMKDNDFQTKKYLGKTVLYTAIFMFISGLIFNSVFGSTLYKELTSPLFTLSGAVKTGGIEEIMLIIFSVCVTYRTAFKILMIKKTLEEINNLKRISGFLTFIISIIAGLIGVISINKNNSFYLVFSAGVLYIILLLLNFMIKIKNK